MRGPADPNRQARVQTSSNSLFVLLRVSPCRTFIHGLQVPHQERLPPILPRRQSKGRPTIGRNGKIPCVCKRNDFRVETKLYTILRPHSRPPPPLGWLNILNRVTGQKPPHPDHRPASGAVMAKR